ncbi:CsbD family protein [Streptomyces chattanoogensis]|uniref:CsbD family protein n=1 Tax=Streptomyces chattanoogensis TaxID=66876 RepID=UPI0005D9F8BE|nr:hypothetical protein T261_0268 [Streptomyces lydicus]
MNIRKTSKNLGEIAEGKTKETIGKMLGNKGMERKGKFEKVMGKAKYELERRRHQFRH